VSRAALLYDRDCGFCRWSTALVLRLDRGHTLEPVAIQSSRGERLLAGLSVAERLDSAHLVTPAGERRSGGAIAAPILGGLPGGRRLAAIAERFPRATERGYRCVAANRSRLSRLVPAAAKRRADALIAARGGSLP
jgi:predicted DCC family thiol-disulfide oxidoreductase YuxK